MVGNSVAQYEILEQLGSGGMGVVYKAHDTKLNRTVALKFLPAQVSQDQKVKERFMQEARAASALDDPHICTIHDIAETDDGQLFIVMAYYDGNTLKYILDERQIEIEEACSIARQMAQGLSAAHEAGIVHRDVKPANIMVTSKGLVKLLDFGVAKLGESSDLTREGSTIGTAAYMSPEQARGESVDFRSDVWSIGAVLYELLTGERPFGGGYEAAVAYSILNEEPPLLESARVELPDGLSDVVSKCLTKASADRMPTAAQLANALAPFTDGTAVKTVEQPAYVPEKKAPTLQRTGLRFSIIATFFLAVLYSAVIVLGLPDWVFPAGVLLMLIGLPIVLYSTTLDRKRAALDSGEREKLTGLKSWLTTQKAFRGGVFAVGGLVALVWAFIGLRAAGVGPFATLISGGALSEQDLLVVADFNNLTSDPTLGSTVTEAFRIDLSQSTVVRLMDRSAVQSALLRMQVNADTALSTSLALAVAEREGVKAIVDGDINSAGASFILNARILSAIDGSQLAAFRETARDDREIVDAIDRLSAKLREEIGESLVDIRGNEPLEKVTTVSVEALRLHTEAENLSGIGSEAEAIELLKAAIAEDSLFAMAYRKLAVLYGNTGADRGLRDSSAQRAYDLRDRLPLRERLLTEANFYNTVGDDDDAVERTYKELLKRYPYDVAALNNLALAYNQSGRPAEAEPLLRKALEVAEGRTFRSNLVGSVANQGRIEDALIEAFAYERAIPGLPQPAQQIAELLFVQEKFEAAEIWIDTMDVRSDQDFLEARAHATRNGLYLALGRIDEAEIYKHKRDAFRLDNRIRSEDDLPREADSLFNELDMMHERALLTGDSRAYEALFETINVRITELGGFPKDDDPYARIAFGFASLGLLHEAQEWTRQHEAYHARTGKEVRSRGNMVEAYVDALRGADIDEAIGVIEEGIKEFGCDRCWQLELGQLHELKNDMEAAIAAYQRFVDTKSFSAHRSDEGRFALIQFRLGSLFEERGDLDQAITYYSKMAERWSNADAVLQPQVAEAKRRIEAILDRKAREGS